MPKYRETCLKKWGVDNYAKSSEFKDLFKNEEWVQNIINKQHETKRKNNSFHISKPEEDYYKYLVSQYGDWNIIRQFSCDDYPFLCDFYIVTEDLFIECNFHWSHGGHPFNENNPEDVETLKLWEEKAKTSEYFRNAIETWTKRDVEKREIAKKNNLNYLEIWNENFTF